MQTSTHVAEVLETGALIPVGIFDGIQPGDRVVVKTARAVLRIVRVGASDDVGPSLRTVAEITPCPVDVSVDAARVAVRDWGDGDGEHETPMDLTSAQE